MCWPVRPFRCLCGACPLDLSRRLAMEMTTRNTIILTNKGRALMMHADNQSGVLSKSSRWSIRPLLLDCNRLHHTDVDQYRGCHFNVHIDYGRLYHRDDNYHRNRSPTVMDVSPRSPKSPRSPALLGHPSSPTGSAGLSTGLQIPLTTRSPVEVDIFSLCSLSPGLRMQRERV